MAKRPAKTRRVEAKPLIAKRPAESYGAEVSLSDLGQMLRRLRMNSGESLADVSKASGLSASFLSLVENGKSDVSLGRLMRLLATYNLRLGDLFQIDRNITGPVLRKEDQRKLYSASEGISEFLLVPDTRRTLMAVLVTFESGDSRVEPTSHPGEEFLHVLSGNVVLEIEHEPSRALRPGDSASFRSERTHGIRNAGPGEAVLLAVVTPPTW